MKRCSRIIHDALSVSAQNTDPSVGNYKYKTISPTKKRHLIWKSALFFITALSMQLFFSNTVNAQEIQSSKYQYYPPAMRQKILFQDTVKNQMALIKARYQKQIDSLIVKEMDGKAKWALINRLTQERNYKLNQINELVKAKMRVAITPKQKEQ